MGRLQIKHWRVNGTPTNADVGTCPNIVINVSYGVSTVALGSFSIGVTNVNEPTISGSPEAVAQELFTPSASDADGDTLTYSISGQPGWVSFNSSTGALFGTPTNADVGTYSSWCRVGWCRDGGSGCLGDTVTSTVFVDSPVSNILYQTQSGKTNQAFRDYRTKT